MPTHAATRPLTLKQRVRLFFKTIRVLVGPILLNEDPFADSWHTEFLAIGATRVQHIERGETTHYSWYQASC